MSSGVRPLLAKTVNRIYICSEVDKKENKTKHEGKEQKKSLGSGIFVS
jgi:hypothetical protein